MKQFALAAFCAIGLGGAAMAQATKPRIVSLGGSVTEIVVSLGAGDAIVARDSTSDFPPEILDLPDVGYIRALSPEGVLSVAPDLILAEQGAGPAEAVAVLQAGGVPFVTVPDAMTAEAVLDKVRVVAAALDLETAGQTLEAELAAGFAKVRARAETVTTPQRVLFILSLQGGRVLAGGEGSSAAGIIALAGGVNAGTGFQGYKQIADEAILDAAPDVILLMDREGDLSITDDDIRAHPALSSSPAAQNGRILRMDGMLLLGFGPRTPQAALALHDAIYGG